MRRVLPPKSRLPLRRFWQYCDEKIGTFCHYVRDVGVAGSNPVTPTIDFPSYFIPGHALGVDFICTLVQIWCEFRRIYCAIAYPTDSLPLRGQLRHP
jgi:hypothetical protein